MSFRIFLNTGLFVLMITIGMAAPDKPPVISLKNFTTVKEWALEITWHAKDSFEDEDYRAELDMTATARLYLTCLDHKDAWGRWESQKQQTSSLVYKASLLDKRNGQRMDYQGLQTPPLMSVANFQIGGKTPGYQLVCQVMYPALVKGPPFGSMDSPLMLTTTEMGPKPVFCTGPLPDKGTTISGSTIIQAPVPPFGTSKTHQTRLGIQFVLTPSIELAPLKPVKASKNR